MFNYQPRQLLITGGSGFIGSNLINYLLDHDPHLQIVNYDALTYAANSSFTPSSSRYHFVQGDVRHEEHVLQTLQQYHIDTIIHCAAETHVDRSIQNPILFTETNVHGTQVLLNATLHYWKKSFSLCPTQCRFYHLSTDEVFGSLTLHDAPVHEHSPYRPRSPYAASKAAADHLVQAYFHTYGLPMMLSYCANNYGKNQHPEKFIPTLITACLENKKIPLYGNGKNIRDWLYVLDHCAAIHTILTQAPVGETYVIAGKNELSNLALAHRICQQMSQDSSLIEYVHDRPGHDFRYALDDRKIRQQLGWKPKTNLLDGLTDTIDFYSALLVTL